MPEIHVRAACARNLPDTRMFGTPDPYCKISLRDLAFKTRVHNNGAWNERFTFETSDPHLDQLLIKVKDSGLTSNTLIGEIYLPVSMFLHGNAVDAWYALNNDDGERAGEVKLNIQFVGTGMPPVAYQAPKPQGYDPQQYPPQQQQYPPATQQQQYPPQQGYGYPTAYGTPSAGIVYGAPTMAYIDGQYGHRGYQGDRNGKDDDDDEDGGGGAGAGIALGVGVGLLGGVLGSIL